MGICKPNINNVPLEMLAIKLDLGRNLDVEKRNNEERDEPMKKIAYDNPKLLLLIEL